MASPEQENTHQKSEHSASSPNGPSAEESSVSVQAADAAVPEGSFQRDTLHDESTLGIEVELFGTTDVGLVREHNEDNWLVANLGTKEREAEAIKKHRISSIGSIFAVCDGMGGAAAGEVASQMAVDIIYNTLSSFDPPKDRDEFALRLVEAVKKAGIEIYETANTNRSQQGMGTTGTVAGLVDHVLFIAQVGDSRGYLQRQGKLTLVTKDQSLVNQLIEAGQLSEEEAQAFEHSNIILQALGTADEVNPDLTFLHLCKGDRLLLCSDGLSGLVHESVMEQTLVGCSDNEKAALKLVELAKAGGGHDNVTVVLVTFGGEQLSEPGDKDIVDYQQYPLPMPETAEKELSIPPEVSDRQTLVDSPAASRRQMRGRVKRWLLVAAVIIACLVGFRVLSSSNGAAVHGGNPLEDSQAAVPVRVQSDVRGAELFVDGKKRGALRKGRRLTLQLVPGAYRFEARQGDDLIVTRLVAVDPGVPSEVSLSAPAQRR